MLNKEKEVIFEVELLQTIEFCTHYHAYSLSSEKQTSFIKQCHLLDYHPYGLYNLSFIPYNHSFMYVVTRSNIYLP